MENQPDQIATHPNYYKDDPSIKVKKSMWNLNVENP
jgi:hypothetical protein